MSRSFKHRPFTAICGGGSAKHDKVLAHRGERRANQRAVQKARKEQDFENFLAPHKFECHWNNTYCWGRDGNQNYCGLSGRDWYYFTQASSSDEYFGQWPPLWYQAMLRK